jgi:hypothetical protein
MSALAFEGSGYASMSMPAYLAGKAICAPSCALAFASCVGSMPRRISELQSKREGLEVVIRGSPSNLWALSDRAVSASSWLHAEERKQWSRFQRWFTSGQAMACVKASSSSAVSCPSWFLSIRANCISRYRKTSLFDTVSVAAMDLT